MSEESARPSALGLLDLHFVENRARVLELAAFLDRLDRSTDAAEAHQDFRYLSLMKVLEQLATCREDRARNILLTLSDPTTACGGPACDAAGFRSMERLQC